MLATGLAGHISGLIPHVYPLSWTSIDLPVTLLISHTMPFCVGCGWPIFGERLNWCRGPCKLSCILLYCCMHSLSLPWTKWHIASLTHRNLYISPDLVHSQSMSPAQSPGFDHVLIVIFLFCGSGRLVNWVVEATKILQCLSTGALTCIK